jgi:hypothetical protein
MSSPAIASAQARPPAKQVRRTGEGQARRNDICDSTKSALVLLALLFRNDKNLDGAYNFRIEFYVDFKLAQRLNRFV